MITLTDIHQLSYMTQIILYSFTLHCTTGQFHYMTHHWDATKQQPYVYKINQCFSANERKSSVGIVRKSIQFREEKKQQLPDVITKHLTAKEQWLLKWQLTCLHDSPIRIGVAWASGGGGGGAAPGRACPPLLPRNPNIVLLSFKQCRQVSCLSHVQFRCGSHLCLFFSGVC